MYELITDISEENLIKKLPKFDACTLRFAKLGENILKHCPKLKVISRHGVGYDNIDLAYIKKKNISLSKFIYSLGIRHIGQENAKLLSKTLKNSSNFFDKIFILINKLWKV